MIKEDLFRRIEEAIVAGDGEKARSLAGEAVESRLDLMEVVEKGYAPGLQKVGDLWEKGEYFLPELIASAEAMKAAMDILQPEMAKARLSAFSLGKAVIGTVEGDIHDIGKNLVASMLRAGGFEVVDLGADVKMEAFVEAAEAQGADLICLSALLTTTMLNEKRLIEMLRKRNLRAKYKVLVGGAPASQKWADEIGADGYAENAMAAVRVARGLVGK